MLSGGLPHDAMHDILEGIAPCEIKLVLSHCIAGHPFTLDEFNDRLLNFNYGYSECDKQVPILSRTLHSDKSLRSSASQMLLLISHFLSVIKLQKMNLTGSVFYF